jgi:hypothetical protein
VHHRQGEAGIDPPAVDEDSAGAALAMVAPLLGAEESQMLAQSVEQGGAAVEGESAGLAVHAQADRQHGGRWIGGFGAPRLG